MKYPLSVSLYSLAVIRDVAEKLSGMCPAYFGVGEKLFNQNRIVCERILKLPAHQRDKQALQVL